MKFYLFLLSCLFAFLAGHMINYSVIFIALEAFDSHLVAGIGYGLCFGPPILLGWFAGSLCDKFSAKNVILIAQNSYFISVAVLAFYLLVKQTLTIELLYVAALFSGIGWSFVAPARFAAIPAFLGNVSLATGTIALNIMVMMGFGLAPLLLKTIQLSSDWQGVFTTIIALLICSAILLLMIKPSQPKLLASKGILLGLKKVKQSPQLLQFLLLACVTYLLMGPMQVLLPTLASEQLHLNEIQQGHYLSLVAYSLIVGGVLALVIKNKLHFGKTLFISVALAGLGIGLLSLGENISVSIGVLIFASISGGIAVSFIVAGIQHYTDETVRGRVMAIYTIIGQFIPALSGFIAGLVAQYYGVSAALQLFAALIVAATVTMFFISATIKNINQLQNEIQGDV